MVRTAVGAGVRRPLPNARPQSDFLLGRPGPRGNAGARPRVIALARVAPSRIAGVRIACAFARLPRRTRRPLGGDVPAQVLDRAAADGSRDDLGRDDPARAGIRAAFVPRIAVDSVSLWLGGVRLRRLAVSRRRLAG